MDIAQIVGIGAAAVSVASFTPQAWKIIRSRKTDGLSFGMYLLTCLAFAGWLTFGILTSEWALIVPNILCLILAAFILLMMAMSSRHTEKVAETLDPAP